jgi:hypothetical protein
MVENIASQAVNGIGWIDDYAAIPQNFRRLTDEPGLGIVGMDVYQHNKLFNVSFSCLAEFISLSMS